MSTEDVQKLYKNIILDHYRNPRGKLFTIPLDKGQSVEKYRNCGDRVKVWICVNQDKIEDLGFIGDGCSISISAASMVCEHLKGLAIMEARRIIDETVSYLDAIINQKPYGKLDERFLAFEALDRFQTRVACARLAFDAIDELLPKKNTLE